MKYVSEVIVVEGRYDKNTVSQAVRGTVIETSGFGVFSDKEKIALLRKLADKRGLIILTDSDGAGFFIRGRLRGMLNDLNIKHAYMPDRQGPANRKGSRKPKSPPGVEDMCVDDIVMALVRAGATFIDETKTPEKEPRITKNDLFIAGLTGGTNSAQKRSELKKRLSLPERLSTNGLVDVLNILYSKDEFMSMVL